MYLNEKYWVRRNINTGYIEAVFDTTRSACRRHIEALPDKQLWECLQIQLSRFPPEKASSTVLDALRFSTGDLPSQPPSGGSKPKR